MVSNQSPTNMPSTSNRPGRPSRSRAVHHALGTNGSEFTGEYRCTSVAVSVSRFKRRPREHALKRRRNFQRSASNESSMRHTRALSVASSLGDDSRFEHVTEGVHSSMKAIKDSLTDSSFKLPSIQSFIQTVPNPPITQKFTSIRFDIREVVWDTKKRDTRPNLSQKRRLSSPGSIAATPHKKSKTDSTDIFDELTGDVVILGGFRGSLLKSAKDPNKRLWVPIKAGLRLATVDLSLGLEDEDEEKITREVVSDGMLKNLGPIEAARRLFKRLRETESFATGKLRVHDYGYDWRLSPHRLSEDLVKFLESLPCNTTKKSERERGAFVIAHSFGGLITRHAINQRPELFSGVVYAGTPQNCVNIMGPFRDGDPVLLNQRILTPQVNFTHRTSFAFLPFDGKLFLDMDTKEEYDVDFFNPEDWITYRLSPAILPTLPSLDKNKSWLFNSLPALPAFPSSFPRSIEDIPILGRRLSKAQRGAKDATVSGPKINPPHATQHPGNTGRTRLHPPATPSCQIPAETIAAIKRTPQYSYLKRTLARTAAFKRALHHKPAHSAANVYPPLGVIYGKSDPTVYGARVRGRDGIGREDAFANLAFASGDGVVLARNAMLPDGYRAVKGGVVASERGHVSLLSDLTTVGKVVREVWQARGEGVGLGLLEKGGDEEVQLKGMDGMEEDESQRLVTKLDLGMNLEEVEGVEVVDWMEKTDKEVKE